MACNGSAVSRCFKSGAEYANGEFIQVHPTAIPGADKLRLMSESARGEGGRVWVPQASRRTNAIHATSRERTILLPGRALPRPTAISCLAISPHARSSTSVSTRGLSVDANRQCVYLDLTHIERAELDRKLGGILEIYEKFQGVDPRDMPMKIFPAVHYSMGGLWADYERTEDGGLQPGSIRNQVTNIPGLYAIGECDYQYHGGNRLGANSLLSCIFSGLFVAPCIENWMKTSGAAAGTAQSLFSNAVVANKRRMTNCCDATRAERTRTCCTSNWATS